MTSPAPVTEPPHDPYRCAIPGLPAETIATRPPAHRDQVRMLVADESGLRHRIAADLADALQPGDLLVVNDSETLPAALAGRTGTGEQVEVHLSTLEPEAGESYPSALGARSSRWIVEIRDATGALGGAPSFTDRRGAPITLAGGATLTVGARHGSRLWSAVLHTPSPLLGWLRGYGDPIRYGYVARPWPLAEYRTPFATVPGSAEMPSAGRALTPSVFAKLHERGVDVAHVVLHCGVSSLESGEPPYAEWFEVPFATAAAVSHAKRVIAVGTTVVRALESSHGHPGYGWTERLVTPEQPPRVVDGLLTGWHEPAASHLLMLRALAGCDLLADSYAEAGRAGYRWHEFGDLHLILP